MKFNYKSLLHLLLIAVLIFIVMFMILKDDYPIVLEQLTHVSKSGFLLILALGSLQILLQGYLLYKIAAPYHSAFRLFDGIQNAYIAAFFTATTPLGGGQASQVYAFRKHQFSYSETAAVLWKDFFLYQIAMLTVVSVLMICGMSFALTAFPYAVLLIILGFLINLSVIAFLWTMSRFPRLYASLSRKLIQLLNRIHIVKNPQHIIDKSDKLLEEFSDYIQQLHQEKKPAFKMIIINMARILLSYSLPYFIALCLGLQPDISVLFKVIMISGFIHQLNALTPLPGDAGWSEGMFQMLFMSLFTKTDTAAMMILWRGATYYLNILIGALFFITLNRKTKAEAL